MFEARFAENVRLCESYHRSCFIIEVLSFANEKIFIDLGRSHSAIYRRPVTILSRYFILTYYIEIREYFEPKVTHSERCKYKR